MTIGVLKEPQYETRVSLLPEHIVILKKLNTEVLIEINAGQKAFVSDDKYMEAGGVVVSREEIFSKSDIILAIHLPCENEIGKLQSKIIVGFYQPLYNAESVQRLKENKVTAFSMDMLPRTTRAQSMDVLSSQANIAGYKAVLLAANLFPKYFPMFMTAAGSIPPAKVLILGAGVAGLQATATARRLGAVVEVFDTRPTVKEEVMSLGAKFIEVEGAADASKAGGYAVEQSAEFLQKQKEKIAMSVSKSDIVITTAQIFGKRAPLLITNEMIAKMKNGSVIIDLAAATGGNTSVTKNDETIVYNGVTIVGNSNLPATMPYDASKMYGKNICNFLQLIIDKEARPPAGSDHSGGDNTVGRGKLNLNMEDELVKGTLIS